MKLKTLLEDIKIKTKVSMETEDVELLKKELENKIEDEQSDMDGVDISEGAECDKIATVGTNDGDDAGTVDDRTDNTFDEENAEAHLVETGKAFKKLKGKLSHQKGIYNPGGLAAAIGRKKYGTKKFTKKSIAGKKAHNK